MNKVNEIVEIDNIGELAMLSENEHRLLELMRGDPELKRRILEAVSAIVGKNETVER